MSARFPGAGDAVRLWRLLCDGSDAIGELPATRFDVAAHALPRHAGVIDGVDRFDAAFFGISPREAQRMDPQQRLALEAAWDALADAGQAPLALRGSATGVFVGVHRDEYGAIVRQVAASDLISAAGGSRSGVSGRISYVLGLEGPSLALDTDRSSSLVAVHLACESLRRGECELALAGGVNLLLAPELSIAFARAGMLAHDGRIKFCDARADGIVRSDGVGMVALKPLWAARCDGDRIYAVVLGGAINHDGGRSGDLMTPSTASQEALLRAACGDAGVSPHAIQYVEAHGTGTVVGDPVEIAAIASALQHGRAERPAVRVGSIKTNLGHTEAAAGIAGLIKAALAIKHRRLPASLNFETPNPRIRFDGVEVQSALTAWPDEASPLLAGVTSLGLTGVNAHLIVAEAPPDEPPARTSLAREAAAFTAIEALDGDDAVFTALDDDESRPHIVTVSARGDAALNALVRAYIAYLRRSDAPSLGVVAAAAARRRSHLHDRLAVIGYTREQVATALEAWLELGAVPGSLLDDASLNAGRDVRHARLRLLATRYLAGDDVDWRDVYAGNAPSVDLPHYPWQRERYWFEPEPAVGTAPSQVLGSTALVTRELARVLGVADASAIDLRRPFRELGVTSLLAMDLVGGIGDAIGRALPSSIVFNHPDVAALAAHIDGARAPGPAVAAPTTRRAPVHEPIAVIGMSCRFPGGASDPERYWQLLRDGVDAISEVPANRWDVDRWYDAEPGRPGKMRTRWGGFVDDIDRFDAAFFEISPREAEEMDPQQRLLLEVTWDALERAGVPVERMLGAAAGVFVGMMNNNDYVARKRLHDDPARIRAHHATGMATSIAAGRLAYLLGANGPALAVDTACSSSLVAMQLAMQSLRDGTCRIAIAGGVNAILSPEISVAYSQAGMLSPTGRCRTFDASADGYVRSEGCGILVLKRLSDAVADGDRVRAVLLGAAVNQDGRSAGLTAPNGMAQRAVVRAALADAGLTPADVDYVEAHGTGTRLGDPIEVQSLADVFGERPGGKPVLVGSAKASIGHLEAAAGVAGLMKVILALEHQEVPPQVHLRERNPLLAIGEDRIAFPTRRTPWLGNGRRVAGVSSFGFSGTNAHVIVAAAPSVPPVAEPQSPRHAELFVLSARSETALREMCLRHAAHLAAKPDLPLDDVAFSLATTRSHHDHRVALVAGERAQLVDALTQLERGETPSRSVRGVVAASRKRAWLFTGQGAQWPGMGRDLAAAQPVFARALDDVFAAIDPHLPRRLADVMWAAPGTAEAALLDQTGFTQPALFAIEVALAALWRSWGAEPDLVAGHSVGEIAAAHVAGAFSLEDAARLVAARASLMQALPAGGAMFAIAASEAEVSSWVARDADAVAIAGVNGPSAVVIAGAETRAAAIADRFARRGVRTSRLSVSHAFHSPLMEPVLAPFRAVAETVRFARPSIAGIGNVDGRRWGAEVATAEYWVRHVRATVRFADGVRALGAAGVRTFVELGPRPTLLGMVPSCLPGDREPTALLAALRADRPALETALEALGGWYASGGSVDWTGVMPGPRRRVDLPTYAWQRKSYWLSPPPAPSRGRERALSLEQTPWLADHRVSGDIVVPAAALIEWMRAAAARAGGELRSLAIRAPLVLDEREPRETQVMVSRDEGGATRAVLYSRRDEAAPWTAHAEAEVHASASNEPAAVDLEAARARCSDPVDVDAMYAALAEVGLDYGPAFRAVRSSRRGDGEVLAHVVVPSGWEREDFGAHPALFDAALQVAVAGGRGLYLPFACDRIQVASLGETEALVHVRYTSQRDSDTLAADITLVDPRGRVIAALTGFRARRKHDSLWSIVWRSTTTRPRALASAAVLGGGGALAERLGLPRFLDVAAVFTAGERPPSQLLVDTTGVLAGDLIAQTHDTAHHDLALVQACLSEERLAGCDLVFVTQGAIAASPVDEVSGIARAPLWGLVRSARREHGARALRLLDIEASSDPAHIRDALAIPREPELALRGGSVLVPRVEVAPAPNAASTWRPSGTVLVTGATGALGTLVARHLVTVHGARRLLLASRQGAAAAGATALRDELTALGADVVLAACDASRHDAVEALLRSVPVEAPLCAVFHCAGVVDDGVIAMLDPARLDRVFAAKVDAAIVLDELTRSLAPSLERFVLFSSVAGVLGTAGQGCYAAANSFLDAIAARRAHAGLPAQSLAWGLWDPSTNGMSSALAETDLARLRRQGIAPLSVEQGLALLDRCLTRSEPHLVPARLDGAVVARTAPARPAAARPVATRAAIDPSALLDLVRTEIAAVLRLQPDAITDDQPLKSLGLDSLVAIEVRDRLASRLELRLPASLAFDHPAAGDIARFVAGLLVPSVPAPTSDPTPVPPPVVTSGLEELTNEELVSLVRSL